MAACILGRSCRLPESHDPAEFYRNLSQGVTRLIAPSVHAGDLSIPCEAEKLAVASISAFRVTSLKSLLNYHEVTMRSQSLRHFCTVVRHL
jgi:hypothetical protein